MRLRSGVIWAAMAAAGLSGCGGLSSRDLAGRTILSGEANIRHVYFLSPNDADRGVLCVEPMPDIALARTLVADASGKAGPGDEGASAEARLEYSTAVVQLAGRTQSVVLARDLLFRTCVDRANGFLSNEQVFQIYERTIDLVSDLGAADRNATAAQAARAGVFATVEDAAFDDRFVTRVDRVTSALLGKDQDQRGVILGRVFQCGSGASSCSPSLVEIQQAGSRQDLRNAIGRLSGTRLARLDDYLKDNPQ